MGGILLIDAEQPFADKLTGSLEGRGFSVTRLDDGKDSVEYARDHKPDLIILCVELPKMSGYSICNKLKKDNDLKVIPLIITSKEATPETFAQHKKLKTRAEEYLIKPFTDGEIVAKIAALNIPIPGGNGAAQDDAFDALDSLSNALGTREGNDSDLSSLDIGASSMSASISLGLSPADDALLASLDDLTGSSGSDALGGSSAGLDLLDLGSSGKEDDGVAGFDRALASLVPLTPQAEPETAAVDTRRRAPEPASVVRAAPLSRSAPVRADVPLRAETRPPSIVPTSAADVQQTQQLRRDNTDLKAKVAELDARLKAADDSARAAKEAVASAASGGGASAREVLSLKEQLRAKEKEIGALKDEVFEKEKENVEIAEQVVTVRAEGERKLEATTSKDVEISSLQAKLKGVEEQRDDLEQQVQTRIAEAETDREEARATLEDAQADLQRLRRELAKSKTDLDRVNVDLEEQKKLAASAHEHAESTIRELEAAVRTQEERALKTDQQLKAEEALREKAHKAVEIVSRLLKGDVKSDGTSADLDQVDAE